MIEVDLEKIKNQILILPLEVKETKVKKVVGQYKKLLKEADRQTNWGKIFYLCLDNSEDD